MSPVPDARIAAIAWHLPEGTLTNQDIAATHPAWSVERIASKTGIDVRHIAAADETAADLAAAAAHKLFESGAARAEDIDFVILCTQSPDYFLPTTACLLQDRLGIPTRAGAFDFNLGCSGFVYGLGIARGLIETGQASRLLLLTADTYSKFIHPDDKSVRTIFGDAGAATLLVAGERAVGAEPTIGPFVTGTDGRGARNLIVAAGGMRRPRDASSARPERDAAGRESIPDHLYMDGGEIFSFTLATVADSVAAALARAGATLDDIDLFVFHQANAWMLEHLRKRIGILAERFVIDLGGCGNTVSSTIPIALARAAASGRLQPGQRLLLSGFGVGYSWCSALLRWHGIA